MHLPFITNFKSTSNSRSWRKFINDGDLHCPCDSYRLRDKCYCNLYIKENESKSC